jgi:DNA-binding Xre family transcriptional regulator
MVSEWLKTVEEFHGLCAYCQERSYQEQDHFIPRSKGGRDDVTNYVPSCIICNKRKLDYTGEALFALFGFSTIERVRLYLETRFSQTIVYPPTPQHSRSGLRLVIKEIAEKQGLNQKNLAAKSQVTVELLNRYWNNNTRRVDLNQLAKIARALGVRTGDLIADGVKPQIEETD